MDKKELRKEIKKKLDALTFLEHAQNSYLTASTLFSTPEWKNAHTIGITVSNSPELDTWSIIKRAWDEGKRAAVPKCLPENKEMVFKHLTAFTDLERVFFGLYEPKECTTAIQKGGIDLMIVPGLAYQKNGFRIGFGGGYFDRYLSDFEGSTVSLAFKEQIVESLPVESFDIPVQKIIVEREVIDCRD
ncbi:5-formyltetrahydrofolate cyclo-ligase [Falsibacillus pallidus]|uniref:5-formyltetrahydrofolate cyclo-ligase n=1 Tax=Falsibacillus pallidus TaxID=493781 RepID=A0A370GJU2_9BACI|nr:5-formyltetrahydrofolate cyclo-ligase [Falsibacillus pallidus]RDI43955.1 5-formyltetrahydrofolate cyclo-ligase [Falsibacillus pallidus]